MKFLIDQQLPPGLARWLIERGAEASHVREIGLRDAADSAIWSRAFAEGWIVVTKDEDFAARRSVVRDGPTVVWLRIGNATNPVLMSWLGPRWADVEAALLGGAPVIEVR
jgi:predicted nuclease of predicted toxin-antitoxin system